MPAPSVVVYKDAYTDSGTSATTRVLAERTVADGDVVAVVWHDDQWASNPDPGFNTPTLSKTAGTAVIGSITKQRDAGSSGHTNNGLFTFTVTTGGTLTLTVGWTISASPTVHYNTAWTFVATGCGGVGNTAMNTGGGTASLTTSDQSLVIAMADDWNAAGGTTTTLTPAGASTPLDAHETDGVNDQSASGNHFSSRGGHWASVSAGTVTYGVSAPSSTAYNVVVCELLAGTGGGGPVSVNAGAASGTGEAPDATGAAGSATSVLFAGSATGISGSWSNTGNATGSGQGTYATWTDSGTGSSATLELATFGAQAEVPSGSTVIQVTCVVRHGETPVAGVASVSAQAYSGTTPVGSAQPLTKADAVHEDTVTFTGLTWADLADLRVRVTATRN